MEMVNVLTQYALTHCVMITHHQNACRSTGAHATVQNNPRTLYSLLTDLLHELGRRELSSEKVFELYSGALVNQA